MGGELLQFLTAESLGGGHWRLSGLLRGRGGTEGAASVGSAPGARFVLLDGTATAIDPQRLPDTPTVAAIGLVDDAPVIAPVVNPVLATTPPSPVHGAMKRAADGGMSLHWCRRARGGWAWVDQVDVPLVEHAERYLVGLGDADAPLLAWEVAEPLLMFGPQEWAEVRAVHAGAQIWVRQTGTHAASVPLLLGMVG